MKKYPIPTEFVWDINIPSYDVGADRRLKLSSQLRLQQLIGELHFEQGGLGCEEVIKHGMTFVITRLNSRIYRAPLLNESVRIVTWHRNSKGAQFFRCYQFLDSQGTPLIDSVSAFALIDFKTHKILRPSYFAQFNVNCEIDRYNGCPDPKRLIIPDNLIKTGVRQIRYSDIDYIGHLNNAVYADIICDAMPGGMCDKLITQFSISYINEAVEGEQIELFTSIDEDKEHENTAWFVGQGKNARCFEARVNYENKK